MVKQVKVIRIRPTNGSSTWDEVAWDGTSNMTDLVTARYPTAYTGGSPNIMVDLISGKRTLVAVVERIYR